MAQVPLGVGPGAGSLTLCGFVPAWSGPGDTALCRVGSSLFARLPQALGLSVPAHPHPCPPHLPASQPVSVLSPAAHSLPAVGAWGLPSVGPMSPVPLPGRVLPLGSPPCGGGRDGAA